MHSANLRASLRSRRGFTFVITLSLMMALGELQKERVPEARISTPHATRTTDTEFSRLFEIRSFRWRNAQEI